MFIAFYSVYCAKEGVVQEIPAKPINDKSNARKRERILKILVMLQSFS
jgi:hypothetical protein